MLSFSKKLVAIARASGATVNIAFDPTAERSPEQQAAYTSFLTLCANAVPPVDPVACYAFAAQPDTGETPLNKAARAERAKPKAEPKPEAPKADAPKAKPEAAKPEKPTKPNADAKRDDYDARVALVNELRASVSALYNGPSLAIRGNPKRIALSVYADLLAAPKHRTTLDRVSARDESALREIIKRGDASAAFDPAAINLDSGIFSRLASVGFIEAAPQSSKMPFRLSKRGAEHARIVFKRAA